MRWDFNRFPLQTIKASGSYLVGLTMWVMTSLGVKRTFPMGPKAIRKHRYLHYNS